MATSVSTSFPDSTYSSSNKPVTTTVKSDISAIEAAINTHNAATTGEHGVTGAIVGSSDSQTLTNKTLTSPVINTQITGTAIVDEDDMVSDSAVKVPTQQSVKAFALSKAGGTLTGEVNLGENAGLVIDSALSADGKYSGIVEGGTAGATLVFGDLCYLNDNDSRWELVDANLSDGYDKKLGVCVLAAASDGDATKMLLYGKVRADSAFPALTVGGPAYMGETAGDIVTTAPATTDAAVRVVGFGNTADELHFHPSPDYLTRV